MIRDKKLLFTTKNGMIKLVDGKEFETKRKTMDATKLGKDDELLSVQITRVSSRNPDIEDMDKPVMITGGSDEVEMQDFEQMEFGVMELLPKNVVSAFRWILFKLIIYPCFIYQLGMENVKLFYNNNYISDIVEYFFGNVLINVDSGIKAYFMCLLIVIWFRVYYRIGRYFVNILTAVYLFIVERKRTMKISIWKKILYCFTWPTFDIIGRYTQYVALFKKVEWKPIPHNSKITIDDIAAEQEMST